MPTKKEKRAKATSPKNGSGDDWGAPAKASSKKGGGPSAGVIGAAVVALLAVVALFGGGSGNPVQYLDVNDEAVLRKAFFGGEVWAMTCVSSTEAALPETVEAVAHRLGSEMAFGAVDCKAKLPGSGRTLMQRWKLKKTLMNQLKKLNHLKIRKKWMA